MKKQLTILLIMLSAVCWGQKKPIVARYYDTSVVISSRVFIGDDYKDYQNLTDRGKRIFDSLDNRGVSTLQSDYLSLESFYMKPGKKTEKFRQIRGTSIFILEYLIWNKNGGFGYELKKEYEIK